MAGKSRLFRLQFKTFAGLAAATLSVAPISNAQARKGAPITYASQGGYQPASNETPQFAQKTGVPIHYAGQGYHAAPQAPAYSRPTTANPEFARTKRIEFRYPDQPIVVRRADRMVNVSNPRTSAARSNSATNASATQPRQYAAVGAPTRIAPTKASPPVLHQPDYSRPAIEETAMSEASILLPSQPNTQRSTLKAFQPVAQPGFTEQGLASWYGDEFHGQPTANGEIFDMAGLTAAHPTLPLPSLVQVVNLRNNREIVVRVNDRGPFVHGRMIDLSKRAADELGFLVDGEAKVELRYLGPAPVLAQNQTGQGTSPSSLRTAPQKILTDSATPPRLSQPKMDPIPNPVEAKFFVQAGSFSQIENAQRLSEELGSSLPVDVLLANVRGADFFRVLIGPYETRADAARMRDSLHAKNIVSGMIVEAN